MGWESYVAGVRQSLMEACPTYPRGQVLPETRVGLASVRGAEMYTRELPCSLPSFKFTSIY